MSTSFRLNFILTQFAGDMALKEVMEEIIGRKLKFEIKIGDFNLDHPDLPFTVSKFFDWAEPPNKQIKQEVATVI
ncbi:hypothetical protein FRX31_009193 [Thalictrum thalictroides]|uniref:Uncharacterized protein n=1 Tax=Thalictrum thalictroides TaxID=46969 RepID=A0A7J6WXI6_THATH|nr:hypothetical protein FRX31_009193 [Thalictrum thalictroides]